MIAKKSPVKRKVQRHGRSQPVARSPQPSRRPNKRKSLRVPSSDDPPVRPFVVGIGASAGGLRALEEFFAAMPSDSGMAFVVVTHQHPQHKSLLPALLAKRTRMSVEVARDRVVLEPNRVYVSPPGNNLALLNRAIQSMEVVQHAEPQLPIDYFFRSLARDQDDRAICIVLSGTGTDGTLGLRAIKGHSGMAMVQDERSAHYAGMPHSAAATLLADYVLRPQDMPAQLRAYAQTAQALSATAEPIDIQLENALPKLFVLLRNRTGHDFSGYKLNTMQHRVERRMRVHQIVQPLDYVSLLQSEPHELDLLFQELLINVTQFFRDPEAYDALALALAKHIDSQPDPVSLRVWVAACSTGEESYSLAMLATQLAERAGKRLDLQIFATDLDPQAIVVARSGLYPSGIAADVGTTQLQRFFVAEGNGYRICKQLRDHIVFATQNILRDPPFTKLDLLACRNLMIYLSSELQQRILPLFHYALKPGGLLWLGTSETATGFSDLFVAVDRKWKIYERRGTLATRVPAFDLRLRAKSEAPAEIAPKRELSAPFAGIADSMDDILVERFAPPTLVVNDQGDIAYIHGRTGAYLEPGRGEPRYNLFAMAREGLPLSIQSAMRIAASEDREVVHRGVSVRSNGGFKLVNVFVRRITEPESLRGLFRVTFVPCRPVSAATINPARVRGGVARVDSQTENALRHAHDSLRGTIDALRTSNEELTSSNEELQSTNEELQSSNEELETTKEELQSLNEELQTVNGELQMKIDELALVNDDMQNLLNGTNIATLFLDRELRIKRFTEQARRVVRLIPTDVGRPIGDLVPQVHYDELSEDAQRVLATLVPHETEVTNLDGQWLLVRLQPYRTAQNVIDGVVITFVDIDRVKRAESLAASRAFAESIVQTVREPLLVLDGELRIVATNRAFSRLFGLEQRQIDTHSFFDVSDGAVVLPGLRKLLEGVLNDGREIEAYEFTHEVAGLGVRHIQLNARRLEEHGASAGRVLVAFEDVTKAPM